MPRCIAKLTDKECGKDYYLEWSSVVDAPVTQGVSLSVFKEYYLKTYGTNSESLLVERLKRVEKQGTSCMLGSPIEELVSGNRAGVEESEMTIDELIRSYCRCKNNNK
jgi:hypothetical protein